MATPTNLPPKARPLKTSSGFLTPPETISCLVKGAAKRAARAVGRPQSFKYAIGWGLREFSIWEKLVPPAPPISNQLKPAACNFCRLTGSRPLPTSLTMTGTPAASLISSIRSSQTKSRSPSGMGISWATLRWICRASACRSLTILSAALAGVKGLTLANKRPSGLASLAT